MLYSKVIGLIFCGVLCNFPLAHAKPVIEVIADAWDEVNRIKTQASESRKDEQTQLNERKNQAIYYNAELSKNQQQLSRSNEQNQLLKNQLTQLHKKLMDEKLRVRDLGRQVHLETLSYLEQQKTWHSKIEKISADLLALSSEVPVKVDGQRKSGPRLAVIQSMAAVAESSKSERTTYSQLSSDCQMLAGQIRHAYKSYATLLDSANLPKNYCSYETLSAPTEVITRLEKIKISGQARVTDVTARDGQVLSDLSEEVSRLTSDDAFHATTQNLKDYTVWLGEMSFLETVKGLVRAKTELAQSQVPEKKGQRKILMPALQFYQKVLHYRGYCSEASEVLDRSAFSAGCIFLKPLVSEAEDFFKEFAVAQMNLNLFFLRKKNPTQLLTAIEQLEIRIRNHRGSVEAAPLLEPILLVHDELMSQWNSSLEAS